MAHGREERDNTITSLLKSSQKKSQMKHVEFHWCTTGTNTKKTSQYKEKKEKGRRKERAKEERKLN